MVGDVIDHHLETETVSLGDQSVEVVEGAVHRVDIAIVGDVVSEVVLGGGIVGRKPDGVDAEGLAR